MNKTKTRPNFETTLDKIIATYEDGIERINNYRERSKARTIVVDGYDLRTLQEIDIEKQRSYIFDIATKTEIEVDKQIKDYEAEEKDYFTLDGSLLTDDAKLFDLSLNQEQLDQLELKYKENYTMLSLCFNYSKLHGLTDIVTVQPSNDRINILHTLNEKILKNRFHDYMEVPYKEPLFTFNELANKYKEQYLKQIY